MAVEIIAPVEPDELARSLNYDVHRNVAVGFLEDLLNQVDSETARRAVARYLDGCGMEAVYKDET